MEDQLKMTVERHWYFPVCNEEEIDRVINVQTANDFLLKLRADTIVDNMRLFRVYRNRALKKEGFWSLEKSFADSHYKNFLNNLTRQVYEKCKTVSYGDIFSTDPNGMIFPTDYGIVSTISDSLKYFIEYMNLGMLDFGDKIPTHVRYNAIRIALRIMLQTEALDFDMDPRGIIPYDIQDAIHHTIPFQMQFLAGHEFAHLLLGHIDGNCMKKQHLIKSTFKTQSDYGELKVYSIEQHHEFDADVAALTYPKYSGKEKEMISHHALTLMGYLSIYEDVCHVINPPVGPQTHPSAIDRYYNLMSEMPKYRGFQKKYFETIYPNIISDLSNHFCEEISYRCDEYEMYGSVYLDEPNTMWRGRELIDRVDYY